VKVRFPLKTRVTTHEGKLELIRANRKGSRMPRSILPARVYRLVNMIRGGDAPEYPFGYAPHTAYSCLEFCY